MERGDDYNFKGSFLVAELNVHSTIATQQGKLRLKVMEQRVISLHFGLQLNRHSFLHSPLDVRIRQLAQTGIIANHLVQAKDSSVKFAALKEENDKQLVVLSMDHLSCGFIVWIIMLSMAVAQFFLECLVSWATQVWRNTFLCYAVKSYYRRVNYR